MRVGNLVEKCRGSKDHGQLGIIIDIDTNIVGTTIVTVLGEDGDECHWYSELIKVVECEQQ